jgi:hypothetical protein
MSENIKWYPDGSAQCPRCGEGVIWKDDPADVVARRIAQQFRDTADVLDPLPAPGEGEEGKPYILPGRNPQRYTATPTPPKDTIEIKECPGKGRGVFAMRDIAAGEIIEAAPVIPFVPGQPLPEELADMPFDWADGRKCILLGKFQLANHANDPNTAFDYEKSGIVFTARKNISAGEEVTYNYGVPLWFSPSECRHLAWDRRGMCEGCGEWLPPGPLPGATPQRYTATPIKACKEAVEAEREACAKVAEEAPNQFGDAFGEGFDQAKREIEAAIRARGET